MPLARFLFPSYTALLSSRASLLFAIEKKKSVNLACITPFFPQQLSLYRNQSKIFHKSLDKFTQVYSSF